MKFWKNMRINQLKVIRMPFSIGAHGIMFKCLIFIFFKYSSILILI